MPEQYITIAEAARRLGVSERRVRRWCKKGILPHEKQPREGRVVMVVELERATRCARDQGVQLPVPDETPRKPQVSIFTPPAMLGRLLGRLSEWVMKRSHRRPLLVGVALLGCLGWAAWNWDHFWIRWLRSVWAADSPALELFERGTALVRQGAIEDANQVLAETIVIAERDGLPLVEARALLAIGRLSRLSFDLAKAREPFMRAIDILDSRPAAVGLLAEAHCELGDLERMGGDHEAAFRQYALAQSLLAEREEPLAEARVEWSLGDLQRRQRQRGKARDHYERSLELLDREDNPGLRAKVHLSLGELDRLEARYTNAQSSIERALKGFQTLRDAVGQANARFLLAEVHRHAHKAEEAEREYRAAEAEFRRMDNLSGIAECLLGLAELNRYGGDLDLAREGYKQSRDYFEQCGNHLGMANVNWCHGVLEWRDGSPDLGEELLLEAKGQYAIVGDGTGRATTAHALGSLRSRKGDLAGGRLMLEEAERAFAVAEDWHSRARVLLELSELEASDGQLARAIELLEEASLLLRESDDYHARGNLTFQFGRLAQRSGDPAAADAHYVEARQHYEKAGHILGIANAAAALGIMKVHSDPVQAEKDLKAAEEMFTRVGSNIGLANVTANLGIISFLRMDYDHASIRLNSALEVHRRVQSPQGEVLTLVSRARLKLECEDYEGAVDDLKVALNVATAKSPGTKPTVLLELARYYLETGNVEQAVACVDEAASLKEESSSSVPYLILRAWIAEQDGRLDDAFDLYARAGEESEREGDLFTRAEVLKRVAAITSDRVGREKLKVDAALLYEQLGLDARATRARAGPDASDD